MLVVLKIPMIYLAAVVWWAVRAEPQVAGGGDEVGVLAPLVSVRLERLEAPAPALVPRRRPPVGTRRRARARGRAGR